MKVRVGGRLIRPTNRLPLIASFFLVVFAPDQIKAPVRIPSDKGAVVVSTKGGSRRWSANWTMEPYEYSGKKAVRFTERGQGHVSPFTDEVHWTLDAVWSAESALQPLDFQKTITTAAGQRVAVERKHFDPATGMMRFERNSGGSSDTKSLAVPADTLAVEGIAGILRFLPFDRAMPFPVHLLSNEPRVYSVTLEPRGTEHVKVAAGEFDCYKVEMVPHVGVLNIFRPFFPKTFFWFTVAQPHVWVRYEGPENGPGSPDVVMELDKVKD